MDAIALSLFANRVAAICEEMGAVLRRSSFSPNIRDRLDYSCAIFDAGGELVEQAAAIPVHLGSMAFAMADIVGSVAWSPGSQLILNDPFSGGTHLPDVTVIAPVFVDQQLIAFVANRAHHADIGAEAPGSMPLSRTLAEEGLLIPPTLIEAGQESQIDTLVAGLSQPQLARGDFAAQFSANSSGRERIMSRVLASGVASWEQSCRALNDYGEQLASSHIARIPEGSYSFEDALSLGPDLPLLRLRVEVQIKAGRALVDFAGSAAQVAANLNCPLPVTAAAVHYVFRSLMPEHTPGCGGTLRPVTIKAAKGCLLNARPGAAVAAGNVETSMRVVDLVCGALAHAVPMEIAAASQGTMNNLAMGNHSGTWAWDYYETLAGGCGACQKNPGASARHSHMTNTLNTPAEVLEHDFPVRIRRYSIREGSGGDGMMQGGNGLVREYEFRADAEVCLIGSRRDLSPWGLAGGQPGAVGRHELNGQSLSGRCRFDVVAGDRLTVFTPGGGGWGEIDSAHND
jgi:N-methylhydantoinase B